jgi:chemotaxis protein CheD
MLPKAMIEPRSIDEGAYLDPRFARRTLKLSQGEYGVVDGKDLIVTTLGSCVSACIRDTQTGRGGMNHFMLPNAPLDDTRGSAPARYGAYAMELLVNELMKSGARRESLEAKVFGAASLFGGDTMRIGARNAAFVRSYLLRERIPIVREDLEGTTPRKVYFFPDSGRVLVRYLRNLHNTTLLARDHAYQTRVDGAPVSGGIDLFAPLQELS